MLLILLVLLVGAVMGTPVSPAEIAAARTRCTTQCDNANKQAMAACMRECWNAFFSDRKQAARHAPHLPARAAAAKAARAAALAKPRVRSPHSKVAPAAVTRMKPKKPAGHHKKALAKQPGRHVRIVLGGAHLGAGLLTVALMIFALL